MSQEAVEVVAEILDAWSEGDFGSPVRHFSPRVEFRSFMPDTGEVVCHGFDEVTSFMRDWLAQWERYRVAPEAIQPMGRDTVFAAVRQDAVGKHSGAAVGSPGFSVWKVRSGKVEVLSLHYDRDAALEAAGLSE